jgi:nucleoside 2-deoxyribosyltransferase
MTKEEILEILQQIDEHFKQKETVKPFWGSFSTMQWLYDNGYIDGKKASRALNNGKVGIIVPDKLTLTEKAITMLEGAKKSTQFTRNDSKTCFVAMWFDTQMDEAREVIKQAIIACGYEPIIIDEVHHNDHIPNQIYQKIDECRFMIADFTGHRGGVYYEAGYAKGKGKNVIHCVRKDDFDSLHFDIKQINNIQWFHDPEGLDKFKQVLIDHINKTIPG